MIVLDMIKVNNDKNVLLYLCAEDVLEIGSTNILERQHWFQPSVNSVVKNSHLTHIKTD